MIIKYLSNIIFLEIFIRVKETGNQSHYSKNTLMSLITQGLNRIFNP